MEPCSKGERANMDNFDEPSTPYFNFHLNIIHELRVLIPFNCFDKTVLFPKFEESKDSIFVSFNQIAMSLKHNDMVLMMVVSLRMGRKAGIYMLLVMCEFPDVFLEDISDFSLERGVEFAIDLVPGTRPVSMAPYKMFVLDLSEPKKHLEDLLEKKFVKHSVSPLGALMYLVIKKDVSMRLCRLSGVE